MCTCCRWVHQIDIIRAVPSPSVVMRLFVGERCTWPSDLLGFPHAYRSVPYDFNTPPRIFPDQVLDTSFSPSVAHGQLSARQRSAKPNYRAQPSIDNYSPIEPIHQLPNVSSNRPNYYRSLGYQAPATVFTLPFTSLVFSLSFT
jgi:hypothetical protein